MPRCFRPMKLAGWLCNRFASDRMLAMNLSIEWDVGHSCSSSSPTAPSPPSLFPWYHTVNNISDFPTNDYDIEFHFIWNVMSQKALKISLRSTFSHTTPFPLVLVSLLLSVPAPRFLCLAKLIFHIHHFMIVILCASHFQWWRYSNEKKRKKNVQTFLFNFYLYQIRNTVPKTHTHTRAHIHTGKCACIIYSKLWAL